jgi:hypothetical protein
MSTPQLERRPDAADISADAGGVWLQEELYDSLYYTDNWIAVVNIFHGRIGLTQGEIARGAGVSQATVARWLESSPDAPVRAYGCLDDLRYVVLWLLRCRMGERLIAFWLAARNVDLRGADPLLAISEGRFEQVMEIASAFVDGRPTSLA